MKQGEVVMVGVSVSLGLLLLAGAATAGVLLLRKGGPAASITALPPVAAAATLPVGNGVVAPVGSSSTAWSVQQAQEAERLRDEAWRKADKISGLERDLATAQNEIKRLLDQLNVLDASAMPPDIVADVVRQRQQYCWSQKPAWRLDWRCDIWQDLTGDGGRWQKLADDAWEARKADQRRPLLTRLSELNATQLAVISNLKDLGVTKQPATVRTT